jgi:hypothetical protein
VVGDVCTNESVDIGIGDMPLRRTTGSFEKIKPSFLVLEYYLTFETNITLLYSQITGKRRHGELLLQMLSRITKEG